MSAPERIYIHTDAHDDTYYELSDCCDDEVDYIRADIHEAEIAALKSEIKVLKLSLPKCPPCKGTNCGCTDGVSHSSECLAQHVAVITGRKEES